jgi:CheY-like chemotaxis protein
MLGKGHMSDRKRKILVVDDETIDSNVVVDIFAEHGHSVRSAENGFSALLEIRQEVPNILLSDLNMPGISGIELLGGP